MNTSFSPGGSDEGQPVTRPEPTAATTAPHTRPIDRNERALFIDPLPRPRRAHSYSVTLQNQRPCENIVGVFRNLILYKELQFKPPRFRKQEGATRSRRFPKKLDDNVLLTPNLAVC
jgi:hypothetical protein